MTRCARQPETDRIMPSSDEIFMQRALEQTLAQRYKRWEELEDLRASFEAE